MVELEWSERASEQKPIPLGQLKPWQNSVALNNYAHEAPKQQGWVVGPVKLGDGF